MLGKSFQIARIAGVAIEVHPSLLVILGVLTWSLSARVFPDQQPEWSTAEYWTLGAVAAVLFLATVLIHELAHALVASRHGLEVPKITLFIFGGVSSLSRQPRSSGEEFAIAVAGPLTSLGLALVAGAIAVIAEGREQHLAALFAYLALVNGALAVFNMLPGFPLDGGRVLRAILWKRSGSFVRATRQAAGLGSVFGYGLLFTGLFLALAGFVLNGIWLSFIGWFVRTAAHQEIEGLKLEGVLGGLTAGQIMSADFPSVAPTDSIEQVVREELLGGGHRAVMVVDAGQVVGILTVSDVRRLSPNRWLETSARMLMTGHEKMIVVGPKTPALDVLGLISQHRLNQIPVLEEDRMVGMITRRDLLDRLRLADQVGHVQGSQDS